MTTEVAPPAAEMLPGKLGLVRASALYVAAVLGTGILVLPALAAKAAGPASMVSVLAVLILSIPLAGTFAALASRYPDAGGVATFVQLALGKTASRMAGYWFFFGVAVGAPVVGILSAQYVVAAIYGEHAAVPRWLIIVIGLLIYVPPTPCLARRPRGAAARSHERHRHCRNRRRKSACDSIRQRKSPGGS